MGDAGELLRGHDVTTPGWRPTTSTRSNARSMAWSNRKISSCIVLYSQLVIEQWSNGKCYFVFFCVLANLD